MILSVLAGQKSVQEVIEEEKVSRAFYYQLEDRGLQGMLQALSPRIEGVTSEHRELTQAREQVRTLERTGEVPDAAQKERGAAVAAADQVEPCAGDDASDGADRAKALSTPTMPGGDLP